MQVELSEIGKRFGRSWVFKNVNWNFESGTCCSITGPNGSGKTTMLKIISGFGLPDKGEIKYRLNNQEFLTSDLYKEVSVAAPYLHLIESYTIQEQIEFHEKLKPFDFNLSSKDVLQLLNMESSSQKFIHDCSTGMKQRIKLALSILNSGTLLLLDEPASNLDQEGVTWYHQLLEKYTANKTVIICTNHPNLDTVKIDNNLQITDFVSKAL